MIYAKQTLSVACLSLFFIGGCVANGNETANMEVASNGETPVPENKGLGETFNLETITCWAVSTLPAEDAGYVSVLLYGYVAGQSNIQEHTGKRIEEKVVNAAKVCADNPDSMAVDAVK